MTPSKQEIIDSAREIIAFPEFAAAWDKSHIPLSFGPEIQFLFIMSTILLGLLTIYMLFKRVFLYQKVKVSQTVEQQTVSLRAIPEEDCLGTLDEIEAILDFGREVEAMKKLHEFYLSHLHQTGAVEIKKWKSNTDYLTEYREKENRKSMTLQVLNERFDSAVYGMKSPTVAMITNYVSCIREEVTGEKK